MRVAIVFACLCALALALPTHKTYKVADKEWLEREKAVLYLFDWVNQPSYHSEVAEYAKNFKYEGKYDMWTKPEYAKEFFWYYEHDILPQGEVFSVFYPEHLKQAIALFKTFYYAKDWETFYRFACWARMNVNEGLFVYSFSVAVVHSKFGEGLVLPPIYEIYPQYFFNDETIFKAQQYKQHYFTYDNEYEVKMPSFNGPVIQSNYSGWYMNIHPEQSMSYFTEDIGLNSYYYYAHIFSPWWMETEEMEHFTKEYRGEYFYYFYQQILARYYLERLSNGFGEIPHFSWEYPFEYGYYPSLTYQNGLKFPTRPNHASFYYQGVDGKQNYLFYGNYTYSYTYIKDYERRIRDAVDSGYIWTYDGKFVSLYDKDGLWKLGNLVESNTETYHKQFYGDLDVYARRYLGYAYFPLDQYKVAPSALEHYETSMRDPAFWMMYKKFMSYFYQYQQYAGGYEKKDLYFDGVKVDDVYVDRLITFFDYFYSDISNAVYVDEKEFTEHGYEVRARQYRLNHKPFNYKITVSSEKATDAFVKVFLGPKYDEYGREIDITRNWMNFYELDRFKYTLTAGKTVIERSSSDSIYYSFDRTMYSELYKQVMTAYKDGGEFKYFYDAKYYGFPQRLMLPKGTKGGQTYQFYVMVAPYHSNAEKDIGTYYWFVDSEYSMNYPFDKPVEYEYAFDVPNFYFKDVTIYHKNTEEEINTTWSNY
jgi:hypothetical protein